MRGITEKVRPEFAYPKWFRLLRRIPPLHAVRVKNRYVIVNNNIRHLIKRRYVRSYQFRFRKMRDGTCMIFHHSIQGFGKLIKPRSVRKFYDWDAIFAAIPPGYGREIDANFQTVRGAIWRYERNEKIRPGQFKAIQLRRGRNIRVVLCQRTPP